MATDRYSDDHKIVVGGGAGTLTVDADLDITGGLTFSGSLDIVGDLDVIGNLTVSGSGDSSISSSAGGVDILADLDVAISSSSGDLALSANEVSLVGTDINILAATDLNLRGGNDVNIEATGNDVTITTNQLNINLTGSPERIVINNNTSSCDIRFDVQTSATVTLPASSFQISSTGDGENTGTSLMLNGGMTNSQFFYAPLPDSIPNGSLVAAVGIRYNNPGASHDDSIVFKILSLDPEVGSVYSELDSTTFTCTATTNEYLTQTFNATIDKSASNQISVYLSGREDLYLYCVTLSYVTDRVNINQ